MTGLVLLAMAALASCAAFAYACPFRHCPRCGGTGRNTRGIHRRRFTPCPRCQGTGRLQRPGSAAAHRAVLSVRRELTRHRTPGRR